MKRTILLLCLTAFLVPLLAQDRTLVLDHAWIVDGSGASPFEGWVSIRDGHISALGRAGEAPPGGAARLDLDGLYLLPGLIDAHVHISTSEAALRALRSGVTTARSMGVANYADLGLRELIRKGALQGPELLAAGYHVRPHLPESFFFANPDLSDLMGGVRGAAAYRRVARTNIRRRVDFVKVVATDRAGLPQTDPRRQIMSEEEIRAVVRESRRAGIPVAAHAHGRRGAAAAVRAGVRSIEHGTYLDETTLRLMKGKGTFLVPTVAVVADLIQPGGDYDNPVLEIRGRHMLPRLCSMVALAHRLGVQIVAATDTGYGRESVLRLAHDIEELHRCGLSPGEALGAATTVAARLLGVAQRTGRIVPGLEADLVAVEGNPLEDLGRLEDVLLVLTNGRVVLNRLAGKGP